MQRNIWSIVKVHRHIVVLVTDPRATYIDFQRIHITGYCRYGKHFIEF